MTPSPGPRDLSLDALRGWAILGMVLSGSVAFSGALPAWMYHAQVPPPLHKFVSSLPGITWVDLVFPFFIFAMGAALPLALSDAVVQGASASRRVLWTGLRRCLALLFLALFSQHMKAWVIASPPDAGAQVLSLLAFVLLGLLLGPARSWLKLAAAAVAAVLLFTLTFADGQGFDPRRNDIILVVLANMALFGTAVWWFTRGADWQRWAVLPFVVAVLLATGPAAGGWTGWLQSATPAAWAYQFLFLKYLLILVPGMQAGQWLLQARAREGPQASTVAPALGVLALVLVVCNLSLLLAREMGWNLVLSLAGLAALWRLSRGADMLTRQQVGAAAYLLLLGLALESLEGGIRKDSSTFSYYFVTSGCAFLSLLVLRSMAGHPWGAAVQRFFATQGRNPLLAYVAGSLCVLPLLHLLGLHEAWSALTGNPWLGAAKGLLFTALVAGLVILAQRWNWIWKA